MPVTSLLSLQTDMQGYQRSCVLAALAELDIATCILTQKASPTAKQIASLTDSDERGISVLLDALAGLGYLNKVGTGSTARFSVPVALAPYLDSRSPLTQIPMMRHRACILRNWSRLSWAVHDGCPPKSDSFLGEKQDRVSFLQGMHSVATTIMKDVMDSLEKAGIFSILKEKPITLLDVGGASGSYTQAFLERLPQSKAILFDLPSGITQARARFVGSPLESRVTLVEGDFTRDALPGPCDFAWVSAIIHQLDREGSRELYAKIGESLTPGGMIAIRDFVMEDSGISPSSGALFGINMLVQTSKGRVHTFSEIREDLEKAGFVDVCHAVDTPTMAAIVTGRYR